ncbi:MULTISPECIES: efflux RND transporter permease subunit [Anaerotruncus]|uniref:efflux RND transporter permease subunit n=1 Tax=Anaerotruncus TaxID=244127 RepID=UPI00083333E1|nr:MULTISPECIES: efflux RND transporter permease subunit [Anaerotruncus]RGX55431.1 AcrB/AcrD/AcrF family protein [Anaerotruncus sp. AF02-27]
MTLPKLSVTRPVSVLMCVMCLLFFGISSVFDMEMESTPEMSMPVFMVMTRYEGASPEEVDSLVTDVVESALSTVSDVDSMTSRSSEGSSMTMLEFGYSTDMDEKYDEINEALQRLRLPDSCDDPTIMEMSMDSSSIMDLSISTNASDNIYTYIENTVVPEIEKISGVSEVSMRGGKREYVQVLLREEEMNQYGLSMTDVSSAIASADFNTTAGTINRGQIELTLQGGVSYDTYESLETIPISLPSGDIIHVSDVATISMAEETRSSISRYNGMDNISLSVSKNQSANTIEVCDEIVEVVDELNQQGLGLAVTITNNSGETIFENIMNVVQTLVLGLTLAMLVLVLFLGDWRAALIVATSMPLSVFAALVLMACFGMTINIMSLGGLVVGIGMMVDNSIVVLDSCFRARDGVRSFEESAIQGANLVNSAVIASTLTTIVVFLPISLMEGMSGQLFKEVGFTIVFSMTASLISALTMVPLLFVRMKPVEKEHSFVNTQLHQLERVYAAFLGRALSHKIVVIIVAIALLASTAVMFTQIDMELMPSSDEGSISISVTTKTGLNIDATDEIMTQVEEIVSGQPDVESYSMRGNGGSASLTVYLKDDRSMSTADFITQMRKLTSDIDNASVEVEERSSMSFGSSGVTINLSGSNLDVLEETSNQVKALMQATEGIDSASTSLSDGSPRAEIVVDPVQAAAIGTTPSAVVSTVKNMLSGIEATDLQTSDEEYSVKVMYPEDRFQDVSDLSGLMIDTRSGGQVPLTDVAQIVYNNSPAQIQRYDGDYQVSVTGQTAQGASATQLSNQIVARVQQMDLPDGVTVEAGGSMRTMNEEFGNIYGALATAIFLVFVVMAMQFESMKFSLVVMLSVPFSMTGAFLALILTGMSISMTSLIGLIMLVGIVVNNAIVLIDYTNTLRREQGMPARDALIFSGRTRLRPILMTTTTTVLGLLPTAVGIGGEVEMMQSMAVVVIGGLTVSTLLTLILIPTMYLLFDGEDRRRKGKKTGRKSLFKRNLREQPQVSGTDEIPEEFR